MIAHWLQPDEAFATARWNSRQLGSSVTSFFPEMAELRQGDIALLGYDVKAAGLIRKELYALARPGGDFRLVDLGNLRKASHSHAVQLLRELVDGGLTVLLLGSADDLALSQYQSYSEKIKGVSACLIDNRLEYDPDARGQEPPLLNRLLRPGVNHLFHLSLLGSQRHFSDAALLREFREDRHFEIFGLGQVKTDIADCEPAIRDADMLAIRLRAVQAPYAPAADHPSPNGLDALELCHLARYAGISDKLSTFSIGGWSPSRDRGRVTAQLAAQAAWYFLEGAGQRVGDFPHSMDGLMEYRVDHSHASETLIFWKSTRTNRWWLQVPVREDAGMARHRLVACTYQDYLAACKDELPERLLQAQLRFR